MRKGGRAAHQLGEGKEPACSGSMVPSLNVGQDNCDYRLGQQPQSVPKITRAIRLAARRAITKIAIAGSSHRSLLRVAWLGPLRGGQNAQADEHDRAHTNPLSRRVQEIRGNANANDENEIADQKGRERGHDVPWVRDGRRRDNEYVLAQLVVCYCDPAGCVSVWSTASSGARTPAIARPISAINAYSTTPSRAFLSPRVAERRRLASRCGGTL